MSMFSRLFIGFILIAVALASPSFAQGTPEQPEAIVNKAVQLLGGERYLKVNSQVSRGKFSVIRDGMIASFQSFIDVIVYPDKERTEFKGGKSKFVQTNVGSTGWTFDSDHELVKVQTDEQIANFHRGIRVSLDTLLRGAWRGKGEIEYVGKRPASLGKRNDVVRLKYEDGLTIDYEFAEDGTPMKATYKRTNTDGEEVTEEDRYAQWVDINGIRTPYIVDRFTNGKPTSRINYESLEYNVRVPDSVFEKPSNPKDLKKDLKL